MKSFFVVIGGPDPQFEELWQVRYAKLKKEDQLFIGVDGGTNVLLKAQFPIDVAIGDFDSITEEERQDLEKIVTKDFVLLPREKDETDLEAALSWILHHTDPEDIQSIHIIGAFGGRIDHELSLFWLGFHPHFQVIRDRIQFENLTNIFKFLSPGKHTIEQVSGMKYLSFITTSPVADLTLRGVKYPLEKQAYAYPIALISNEFLEKEMMIMFESGFIIVGQTKD